MDKVTNTFGRHFFIVFIFLTAFGINTVNGQGQPSLSINWDIIPYQNFDKPPVDLEDAQIKIERADASITYPLIFSEGKTVLINQLSYQHFQANFNDWPGSIDEPEIGLIYAAQYMLMLQQRLSEKWSLWMLVTPGMASDLQADISQDDFNLQAAAIAIKHYSPKFSLGLGAAYSTQFGEGIPLPVLALDWNNGSNMKLNAIVPTNIEFWYRTGPKFDLGLNLKIEGNEYHGDPDIYEVDDPRMVYSTATMNAVAKYNISKSFSFNLNFGYIGLHRFEFYDGDSKEETYDLEPSYTIRFGVQIGG